ncbi:MAG TPA: LON peptidase substrate-binding domain-containing protein [Polyangiaceae bacterium]|jgi:ATP-dependent Lon protease
MYDLKHALDELPIFPLPRLVFFPNTMLPLHVFESRYRKMLADCLETHGAMAVVRLESRDKIARVAGAGIVVQHEQLPDGRSNLVLAGSARVELEELPFLPPYRRARARVLDPVHTHVPEKDHAALIAAATDFVREVRRHDSEFSFELPQSRGPGVLADVCAAHLIVDADVRQRILEDLDDASRVRAVIEELAGQRLSLGERSRVLH